MGCELLKQSLSDGCFLTGSVYVHLSRYVANYLCIHSCVETAYYFMSVPIRNIEVNQRTYLLTSVVCKLIKSLPTLINVFGLYFIFTVIYVLTWSLNNYLSTLFTLINLNHSLGEFSGRHINNIFLICLRKQDLTFYANCLQFCFVGKIRKIFQYVICLKFYPECKVLNCY